MVTRRLSMINKIRRLPKQPSTCMANRNGTMPIRYMGRILRTTGQGYRLGGTELKRKGKPKRRNISEYAIKGLCRLFISPWVKLFQLNQTFENRATHMWQNHMQTKGFTPLCTTLAVYANVFLAKATGAVTCNIAKIAVKALTNPMCTSKYLAFIGCPTVPASYFSAYKFDVAGQLAFRSRDRK